MFNIKVLENEDISGLKEVIEDDNMVYSENSLKNYIENNNNIAFIVEVDNKIIGLAYCYKLERLDEIKPMLYIHSVGILSSFQNKGFGTKLIQFIAEYAKDNGFSECFVITEKSNKRACTIYERANGIADHSDDIVYVIDLK
jgi:ribosomal protein S18 acetylase RimI-like enzyme